MKHKISPFDKYSPYFLAFDDLNHQYVVCKDHEVIKNFGNHFYSEEDAVRFMENKLNDDKRTIPTS